MKLLSKDFRLGNYVMDSVSLEWMRISELTEENITADVLNREKYPLPDGWKMAPISLTDEIMQECGFKPCNNGTELLAFEGYVSIKHLFRSFPLTLDIAGNRMPLHDLKYLHQLQNLYHALTGKELILKK